MQQNAISQMAKAKAQLVLRHPFFASIVLSLPVVVDMAQPTAWTDGKVIGYNPKWFDALPLQQAIAVLAHEAMHIVSLHHTRQQTRHSKKWNVAADYAINAILDECGFELPEKALLDSKYKNMSAEEVYVKLSDYCMQADTAGAGGGDSDPGGMGAVRPAGVSQADLKRAEEETKVLVQQSLNVAKMQGKLPGNIERMVANTLKPQIDWLGYMRNFIKRITKNDYTWMRPNRRHIGDGIYLPSLHSESVGDMVIAIDTSGSIDEYTLDSFTAELNGVLHQVAPSRVVVLYADAEVARVEEFTPDQWPVTLAPCGGGGTDFRPVFDWIKNSDLDLECLIYLTDMYGKFPETAPDYPVLWVSTTKNVKAPWGETVFIDTKKD